MSPWKILSADIEWAEAGAMFRPMVHYAPCFLRALLKVLHQQSYQEETPVTVDNWNSSSKMSSVKVPVKLCCCKCLRQLLLSPRSLFEVPQDESLFMCHHIGQSCQHETDQLIDNKTREAAQDEVFVSCQTTVPHAVRDREGTGSVNLTEPCLDKAEISAPASPCWTTMYKPNHGPSNVTSVPYDPFSPSGPHPSQFTAASLVHSLRNPDPTRAEMIECEQIMGSGRWKDLANGLVKWTSRQNIAGFRGTTDVSELLNWKAAVKKFFRVWKVNNTALQAHLASVTFIDNAAEWWEAHLNIRPDLMLSFVQLCEWITRELVPLADPEYSTLAWYRLQYRGDVEAYLHHLDSLLLHHPLSPRVSHVLAVQPFGQDAVERVLGINDAIPGGITLLQLKRQIRCFAQAADERRRQEGRREAWTRPHKPTERTTPVGFAANTALNVSPTGLGLDRASTARKESSVWCLVCGSTEHIWTACSLRKSKGCAKCGSTGHYIRSCAQRLIPPWHQTYEQHQPENSLLKVPDQRSACFTFPNNLPIGAPPQSASGKHAIPGPEQPTFVNCLSLANIAEDQSRAPVFADVTNSTASCKHDLPATQEKDQTTEELVVLNVPSTVGVCPLEPVEQNGQLVYPICVNGQCLEGFYDIGATVSVMRRDCVEKLQLPMLTFSCPIRVIEFSQPGPLLQHAVEPAVVELAGHRSNWRFVVADLAPRSIVIRLDIDRAWQLARVPGSNQLVSLLKLDHHLFQPVEREVPVDETDSLEDVVEYVPEEHRPWIQFRPERNVKWYADGPVERFCVAMVTAGTVEERETLQQFVHELPLPVQSLVREFPTLFDPPDAVPPVREVCHEIRLLPNALPATPSTLHVRRIQAEMSPRTNDGGSQHWLDKEIRVTMECSAVLGREESQ